MSSFLQVAAEMSGVWASDWIVFGGEVDWVLVLGCGLLLRGRVIVYFAG